MRRECGRRFENCCAYICRRSAACARSRDVRIPDPAQLEPGALLSASLAAAADSAWPEARCFSARVQAIAVRHYTGQPRVGANECLNHLLLFLLLPLVFQSELIHQSVRLLLQSSRGSLLCILLSVSVLGRLVNCAMYESHERAERLRRSNARVVGIRRLLLLRLITRAAAIAVG